MSDLLGRSAETLKRGLMSVSSRAGRLSFRIRVWRRARSMPLVDHDARLAHLREHQDRWLTPKQLRVEPIDAFMNGHR